MSRQRFIPLCAMLAVMLTVPAAHFVEPKHASTASQRPLSSRIELRSKKYQPKQPSVTAPVVVVEQHNSEIVPETAVPTMPQTINYPIDCESYRPLIEQYDWDVDVAMKVMMAESSCNPLAVNPVNQDGIPDYGLFQIHGSEIYNPADNIAKAYELYSSLMLNHEPYQWRRWTSCTRKVIDCY